MKKLSIAISFVLVFSMLFSSFAVGAWDVKAKPIALGEEITINGPEEEIFAFVPEKDGCYVFKSSTDNVDPIGRIIDAEGKELSSNDDCNVDDVNFIVGCEMKAGETYYLICSTLYNDGGAYTVVLEEAILPTSMELDPVIMAGNYPGNYIAFVIKCFPEDSFCPTVDWSIDNEDVASIDGYDSVACGITLKKEGKVTVSASGGGLFASYEITCITPPEIALDEEKKVDLYWPKISESYIFVPEESGYYCFIADNSVMNVIYDSQWSIVSKREFLHEEMLTVAKAYLEKGERYTLVTSLDGEEMSCTVGISKTVPPESVSILVDYSNIIRVGSTVYLKASSLPINSFLGKCNWSVSSDIATVTEISDTEATLVFNEAGSITVTVTDEYGSSGFTEVVCQETNSIKLDEVITVTPTSETDYSHDAVYQFIPDESGYYVFMSNGDCDTVGLIYDSENQILESNDDSYTENDFTVCAYMEEGTVYWLACESFAGASEYTVTVTKGKPATFVEIEEYNNHIIYTGNTEYYSVNFGERLAIPDPFEVYTDNKGIVEVVNINRDSFDLKAVGEGSCNIWIETKNGLVSEKFAVTVKTIEYMTLELDKTVEVTQLPSERTYFNFTPEKSGTYTIFSYCEYGDPYLYRFDAVTGEFFEHDDDGYRGLNFMLELEMTAGETYSFYSAHYSSDETINYQVGIIEKKKPVSIEFDHVGDLNVPIYEIASVSCFFAPLGTYDYISEVIISDDSVIGLLEASDDWIEFETLSIGTATITVVTECGLSATVTVNVFDYEEGGGEDVLLGDLDGDGNVNAKDTNMLKRVFAGVISLTEEQRIAADLDGDCKVNSLDANLLIRVATGT